MVQIAGLFNLIVAFVVAGIVYYIGTLVPQPIVRTLATVVAVIIAILALLAFLKGFIG